MQPILVRQVFLKKNLPPIEVIRLSDGNTGATVRSLCRLIDISRQGQVARIKRTPELMVAFIQVSVATPSGPRLFDVLLDYAISIWAIGIDAGRLEPHQQERVALIKEDAVEAIKRAFSGDAPETPVEALPAGDTLRQPQEGRAAITASTSQLQAVLTSHDQRLLALEHAPHLGGTLGIMPERIAFLNTLAYARRATTSISVAETLAELAEQFGVAEIVDIPAAQWLNVVTALEDYMRQDMQFAHESQSVAPSITPERLTALRAMPYEDYLRTPEWQARRKEALRRAAYRCQLCNTAQPPLQAHHRTYERLGAELLEDLIVLCEHCHLKYHR